MREPFLLVLPRRMADAITEPKLADLARNHPYVRYSTRSLIGDQIQRYLQQSGIVLPEALEFDGTEAVFAMVAAGLGWTISTPLCLIHGLSQPTSLRALPLPGQAMYRTLYLLSHEDKTNALPARITEDARNIAQKLVDEKIRPLIPWAADRITIG
jgi:DNA-binding transcriptional LysR family regulator